MLTLLWRESALMVQALTKMHKERAFSTLFLRAVHFMLTQSLFTIELPQFCAAIIVGAYYLVYVLTLLYTVHIS